MGDPLTEQQVLDRLKALGVDPSTWSTMGGNGPQTPRFAIQMATDLKKVSEMLTAALGDKQGEVRVMQEKLARLKYGGGS